MSAIIRIFQISSIGDPLIASGGIGPEPHRRNLPVDRIGSARWIQWSLETTGHHPLPVAARRLERPGVIPAITGGPLFPQSLTSDAGLG